MAYHKAKVIYQNLINDISKSSNYKVENVLTSKQDTSIYIGSQKLLNLCSSNYLGLSSDPYSISSSIKFGQSHGFGLSSGRIICGTQDIHKSLEQTLSIFHSTDDSILYSSCYDANSGLFEALLTKEDAIISDSLSHNSIKDGLRLSGAEKFTYSHLNTHNLEEILKKTQGNRLRLIATDSLFSLNGHFAPLPEIVRLGEKYNALIVIDESHATGVIGPTGRGVAEYFGLQDQIDVVNSSLGKAFGGATGGYSTGRRELIETLRQKSRPYIFSNSLAPIFVGACMDLVHHFEENRESLIFKVNKNAQLFREKMKREGFKVLGHEKSHIVNVGIKGGEGVLVEFVERMRMKGVFVAGFLEDDGEGSRIRVQVTAKHSENDIWRAVDAFAEVGKDLGAI